MASARVGFFPAALGPAADEHLWSSSLGDVADHLCVGDHVSFFVGAGSDGLITAASLLAAQDELPVYVEADAATMLDAMVLDGEVHGDHVHFGFVPAGAEADFGHGDEGHGHDGNGAAAR